jgi:hypothetical protein
MYFTPDAGYDCSIDETVSLSLPCQWLAKELDLGNKSVEGEFFDDKSRLVAFDPTAGQWHTYSRLMTGHRLIVGASRKMTEIV